MAMGQQHPSMIRIEEIQKAIPESRRHVASFSGIQSDKEYKHLESVLTRFLFELDAVDTDGKADIQHARKLAAKNVEELLKELEQIANHPSRLKVDKIFGEAQQLVTRELTPTEGLITDDFADHIQEIIFQLTQVKTEGRLGLRKARYRALTRICAVQDIIEYCMGRQALALPLSSNTHPGVSKINSVLCEVSKARWDVIGLLMGLNDLENCAHLSRVLTGLLMQLDAVDVTGNMEVRNYRKRVVHEINCFLEHLEMESEGESAGRYDLAQNLSIRQIEDIREKMTELKKQLLKSENASDLYFKPKAQLQGFLTQLDQVDIGKNPCIREARRRSVVEVQSVIAYVDLKEALGKRESLDQQGQEEHPSQKAVWQVLHHLSVHQREVLSFDGIRGDKNYKRLEEMLTKQLLTLDAVETHGDAGAKVARKQAVKFAQNILSYLDMKTDEWEY
ncbi:BAG family molecular chaperone regulator 5 [Callorhinchus milii]|uniref:BAG family molecular chaperone regulator 5 n=1 Tax=Callorhinchus milii TaxID=7868 RepID=A0A4W3INU9_CALMI|nr:BAG family molecular chaperone regulator 5 [Callorhinchus milii]XP_007886467.1 BAG family molecular chaperone regulator 5 [Callorhinchus milii]XP_007886468.1 BAG family molecular chaperone regulator 5 [Callorhinchus milii]XP_007886469.1 BAG family molecular chaperone regulator 5 [Callorhinchus milii]XP_007886470.1 BAG family molecular chaperone regulator 5 [Callorhinchus milii]XP_042194234.1 BAG family molecular chaperone regulator 5 [Callorhinchus milii]|eukprot:gi/632942542/ref/XP_007886466.1/ PREDICTED: BAG family molecular chaperone regulator 5 [Callorhinchus milii]